MNSDKNLLLDFNEICRLCLSKEGIMLPIFDNDSNEDDMSLSSRISICASIQVSQGDGLPTLVCNKCVHRLDSWYTFKEQCRSSDATLRQHAASHGKMPTRSEAGAQQGNYPEHSAGGSERLKRILLGDVGNTMNGPAPGTGHKSVEGSSFQPWDVVTVELNENSEDAGGTEEEEVDVKEVEVLYPDFESEDRVKESVAAGPGSRTGACSTCGKMFRLGAYLREHEASHVGEMKFFCKHCNKGFYTRAKLGLHARAHLLRRCACSVCGKQFDRVGKLRKHLLSHGRDQSFPCYVCGKAFRRKEAVTKHVRVHTGERPYACPFCARCFSGKWNLTQHVRLHTGAKPYVCSYCGKAYRHNVTLRNHVRQVHENEILIGHLP